MRQLRNKLLLLEDFILCFFLRVLKIGFCLELWNEDSPQLIGTLPLTLSGGWRFKSCGSCIRVDSPEGQFISLVGNKFTIDGAHYSVKRRVQIKRKTRGLFFSNHFILRCKRTVLGLSCAALVAVILTVFFLKQSRRTEDNLLADERSEKNPHQSKNEILKAPATSTGSATKFAESEASSPKISENTQTAVDVRPEKFPRARAAQKMSTEKGRQSEEKIDPVRCSPIRHISQSKILERLQGTPHNRRNWYVCR